jgi:hypothetical protein
VIGFTPNVRGIKVPKYHKGGRSGERKKPWQATVRYENNTMFLGYFTTREEALEAEAAFRVEKDNPDTVLAKCYCGTTWVWIPYKWIQKFTKSCGAETCVHPLMKKAG